MTTSFKKHLLLLPCLVVAIGCGKQGTVSGKVAYKGEALKTGIVAFYPEGQGGNFTSPISSDGTYSISNVPPGAAKISVAVGVATPPAMMNKGMMGGRGGGNAKGMEEQRKRLKDTGKPEGAGSVNPADIKRIPEKYADPEASELRVEVSGGTQVHNIDLK